MTTTGANETATDKGPSPALGAIRLAIGALQGLAIFTLHRIDTADAWPSTAPPVFAALVVLAAFLPIVLLGSVGRMRPRTLLIWVLCAGAILAFLGWWDRTAWPPERWEELLGLRGPMIACTAAALFVAHHLILPADAARRWLAPYPAYFDTAWKAGVQLALSLGFVLAFWLLLLLGSALFRIIGLSFIEDLIRQDWFAIPITCVIFALAVHLTDVRDGLIRGVRTVGLMLLGWLLPVITVLAAGFLIALPFAGLGGLWATGSATTMVLMAMAAMIVLINTVYQDGEPDDLPRAPLRWAARIASVMLVPLVGLAFVGLALRIGQYGLTPERIFAAACALVGAIYAAGYAFAAVRPGPWMKPLERTNVIAGVAMVLAVLALFSPIADPARLSVADQVARLERGAVKPDAFDYRFLRFDSGKAGRDALSRLASSSSAAIAQKAKDARDSKDPYQLETAAESPSKPVFQVYPATARLPEGFDVAVRRGDPRFACFNEGDCVVMPVDLNSDGKFEVLLAQRHAMTLMAQLPGGDWRSEGEYRRPYCGAPDHSDWRSEMSAGKIRPVVPPWPSLHTGQSPPVQLYVPTHCSDEEMEGEAASD